MIVQSSTVEFRPVSKWFVVSGEPARFLDGMLQCALGLNNLAGKRDTNRW